MNRILSTVLTNKYCSYYENVKYDQSTDISKNSNKLLTTYDNDRFRTFTKYKINDKSNIIQQRYFDSPTMIKLDDEDDIPITRCSDKSLINVHSESSLDETDLSNLFIFANPYRIRSESMQAITSRHSSLDDFKYVNDVSSILIDSLPLHKNDTDEPVYQELSRIDHDIMVSSMDLMNDMDDNKENRPPLMPIRYHLPSRIPVRTPLSDRKNFNASVILNKIKKLEEVKNTAKKIKPNLEDLLDEWSYTMPKLKELLLHTGKIPIRIPHLSSKDTEFRRLKQLLVDMEMMTSSWANAINQCRSVLQHTQKQSH